MSRASKPRAGLAPIDRTLAIYGITKIRRFARIFAHNLLVNCLTAERTLLQDSSAQPGLMGDHDGSSRNTDNLHITETFCMMSPTGSFCRNRGMNHLAVARTRNLSLGYVSIVSYLPCLVKSRFPETRMT